MRCEILRTLYVKANGEIPCHDDLGERIGLGHVPDDGAMSIDALVATDAYRHLRTELAAGRAPWPGTCESCAFLRPDEPFEDGFAERHLSKIQIEPTLACALGCPGCSRAVQFRDRPGSRQLDLDRFARVLGALSSEGYAVDWVEYCGQGEPLNHRDFGRFVDAARDLLPDARQRLITNGNHDYGETVGPGRLDEFIVSVDGARQESYEQYRIRGSVDRALAFLRDAVRAARSSAAPTTVIWKYILFDHNDSDDELAEAHRLALELGVDVLLFVVTHSAGRSRRFDVANLGDILLLAPSARIGTTPLLERGDAAGRVAGPLTWTAARRRDRRVAGPTVVLDEVRLLGGRVVSVRGWASSPSGGPAQVRCRVGGSEPAGVSGLARPDVPRARADVVSPAVGFAAGLPWSGSLDEVAPLVVEVTADGGRWTGSTEVSWIAASG